MQYDLTHLALRAARRTWLHSIELPPGGGPPPSPHLWDGMLGDCHAFKACMCRTALLKAHGAMKPLRFSYTLATICPDFGIWVLPIKLANGRKSCSHLACPKFRKIDSGTLQNRGWGPPKSSPGPPKSSPEPSKTLFLKDL